MGFEETINFAVKHTFVRAPGGSADVPLRSAPPEVGVLAWPLDARSSTGGFSRASSFSDRTPSARPSDVSRVAGPLGGHSEACEAGQEHVKVPREARPQRHHDRLGRGLLDAR